MKKRAEGVGMVVKFGSDVLCQNGLLVRSIFQPFARQIAKVMGMGIGVVVVSSGAVVAGAAEADDLGLDRGMNKANLAAMGQPILMRFWKEAFKKFGIGASQILATDANLDSRSESNAIKTSIMDAVRNGVVPVLNANDPVAREELEDYLRGVSDNDNFAGFVVELIKPTRVLFLTALGGVYEKDPQHHDTARRYAEVDHRTVLQKFKHSRSTSGNGTGGMRSKIENALRCYEGGATYVAIAGGDQQNVIVKAAHCEPVGTMIGKHYRFAK